MPGPLGYWYRISVLSDRSLRSQAETPSVGLWFPWRIVLQIWRQLVSKDQLRGRPSVVTSATLYHRQRKLGIDELRPAERLCPICGNSGNRPTVCRIQSDPDVNLLHCLRCRGLSASQMPTDGALQRYYGSYYQHREQEMVTQWKPERLARRIHTAIDLDGCDRVRILDYGGGDGAVSRMIGTAMIESRPRALGIDVVDYQELEDRRVDGIDLRYRRDLAELEGDYDLVIASAIFEHIPDLKPVARSVYDKLRPGGFFYARTPSMQPFIRHLSFDMTYPGHVHDLGDEFWNRFGETFDVPVEIVVSRPSIVESGFPQAFVRTLGAYILKFPAHVEARLSRRIRWKWYGGWEVVFRKPVGAS